MGDFKEYIWTSICNGKTSLGPTKYLSEKAKKNLYKDIIGQIKRCSDIAYSSDTKEIYKLITVASKIEDNIKDSVEKTCSDYIITLFEIPQSTISVEMNLVQNVDSSGLRNKPDDVKIPTTISKDELINNILKRRLLLSMCAGGASVLSSQLSFYGEFEKANQKLPEIYTKIAAIKDCLAYSDDKKYGLSGNVYSTVFITSGENKPELRCDATCAPLLIDGTIKAMLELAISHGLPDNVELAGIVLEKSDFSLADKWDLMIGIPLFTRIASVIGDCGYDFKEVGYNFFMMELSKMECEDVFELVDCLLTGDEMANEIINGLCEKIMAEKSRDEFDDFVKHANDRLPINDAYMTSEELRMESFL